ncbi:hypothetical protein SteCoe_33501 [Stentor coeruleus]|uniref:Uncharacterized protein n=1 Tax=Stentor coeruleus TaxID=5963 RepID=A0A1R2AWM9_9CILI|nr:hypothetical protein SteCoe_33501 [Stentor coeruleus]
MTTHAISLESNENLLLQHKTAPPLHPRSFGTDLTNLIPPQKSLNIPNLSIYPNEYALDITNHLHETETQYLPRPGYMIIQESINEKMRNILVDWLIDVHKKFKLVEETLFLTVNILDRYLEKNQVVRENLQLVGVSSMLIASKYEEIYPPEIKDFVYITDNAYIPQQILDMEILILRYLNFNITTPSAFRFLEQYAKITDFDEFALYFARYMIELSLVEYKFLKYKPSNIAASAVYLTQKILKNPSKSLKSSTTSTDLEIRTCAKDILVLLQKAETCTLQAAKKKYSQPKYYEVAKLQIKF